MQTEFPRKAWIAEAESAERQLWLRRRALAGRLRRTDRLHSKRRLRAAIATTVGSALTIGALLWMTGG